MLRGLANGSMKERGWGMKHPAVVIALQALTPRLAHNSVDLECEILQFPLAFDLNNDRISRIEVSDQRL